MAPPLSPRAVPPLPKPLRRLRRRLWLASLAIGLLLFGGFALGVASGLVPVNSMAAPAIGVVLAVLAECLCVHVAVRHVARHVARHVTPPGDSAIPTPVTRREPLSRA